MGYCRASELRMALCWLDLAVVVFDQAQGEGDRMKTLRTITGLQTPTIVCSGLILLYAACLIFMMLAEQSG